MYKRQLLDRSHSLTAQGAGTKPPAGGRTWLIPANPKYYDVEAAFAAQDTIRWKQSSRVAVGDTIYLYVAAPVSAILYQCKAVEAVSYTHLKTSTRLLTVPIFVL